MPPDSASDAPGGPPRLICRCFCISSLRIAQAIRAQGLTRLDQVQSTLRAGSGCTGCHPEIEEILAEARGEPVSKRVRMENRARCRSESEQRIEVSLFTAIVPKLPEGTRVELVCVDGLRIDLHITPRNDAALQALIQEKLRKLVCQDLEIVFS